MPSSNSAPIGAAEEGVVLHESISNEELFRRIESIAAGQANALALKTTESGYITRFQAICAFIALVVSLGTMVITLKTDISTLQYQATISVGDRAGMHGELTAMRDSQTSFNSQVLTRLARIEALVQSGQGQNQSYSNNGGNRR